VVLFFLLILLAKIVGRLRGGSSFGGGGLRGRGGYNPFGGDRVNELPD
jgi:hypothetical protein